MDDLLLRVERCVDCEHLFWICRRCYRGQTYCGDRCRGPARAEQAKTARAKHQKSPRGRRAHSILCANFEDSILINEKLVKNDVFTSIHIEELECVARDTKLGKEEITRDIPNVGEEALKDLDESGIVRIGAEVKSGDILVGKITPKGETQLSPEEKLLRAIFGERAGDVRDTSLRVPPGVVGVVIGARVFARKGTEKDERAQMIEDAEKELFMLNKRDEVKIISEAYYNKMRELLVGKTTASRLVDDKGKVLIAKGDKIELEALNEVPHRYWHEIQLDSGDGKIEEQLEQLAAKREEDVFNIEAQYTEKISKLTKGDELPPGVIYALCAWSCRAESRRGDTTALWRSRWR